MDTLSIRERSSTYRGGAMDVTFQSNMSHVKSRIYDHLQPLPEFTAEGMDLYYLKFFNREKRGTWHNTWACQHDRSQHVQGWVKQEISRKIRSWATYLKSLESDKRYQKYNWSDRPRQ